MKNLILLFIFLISFQNLSAQEKFYSDSDVNLYLQTHKFKNYEIDLEISFSGMGGNLIMNGRRMGYNPVIYRKSYSIVILKYYSLSNPNQTSTFILNGNSESIIDASNQREYKVVSNVVNKNEPVTSAKPKFVSSENVKLGSYQKELKEKGENYWKELMEKKEKGRKEAKESNKKPLIYYMDEKRKEKKKYNMSFDMNPQNYVCINCSKKIEGEGHYYSYIPNDKASLGKYSSKTKNQTEIKYEDNRFCCSLNCLSEYGESKPEKIGNVVKVLKSW